MKTIVSAFVCYVLVTTSCFADKVLILAPTVSGGQNSLEAEAARGLGYGVDVVDNTVWANMATTDPDTFTNYRAIILGDPSCGQSATAMAAAEVTTAQWSPRVNGNIIIVGTDPAYPAHPGGPALTTNAIRFAAAQPGKTGLYVSLSCYYWSAPPNTPVPVLDQFGTFTVTSVGCYNNAHIVATHPALSGLTDAILSGWSCSVHEAFDNWPSGGPNGFLVLVIARDAGTSYTAPDLSVGTPYILARGLGLAPVTNRFELTPTSATNPTNTMHTVCVTVVTNSAYAGGVDVVFDVTNGPNVGTTGTAMTDAHGVACFTYAGIGGVGVDTIVAHYTNSLDQVITSDPVTKAWENPCGSGLTATASADCETNQILVAFSEPVSDTGTNIANYSLDHGFNVTGAAFINSSRKDVLITADQNFAFPTTYTLQISNVQDVCGRYITPNPTDLMFQCVPQCPGLECPSNIVVQCTGPGGTPVDYDPHVNPGCSNVTVTCFPPSGTLFHVGTKTVYCYASQPGNPDTNYCFFTVTVTDEIPPVINCPSNIVVYTACSNALVPFTVTASDNCCTDLTVKCVPPSGSSFSAGTTTSVHCTATDCSGNSNSCDFTVQVIQVTNAGPPQITYCPSNIVVCATNGCGPMPDVTSRVRATDGGATLYVSQSIAPGTMLCSNTNVTFTVSNLCGEVSTCTVPVVVGPCCCNALLALELPTALTNIAVWESSGGTSTAYNFPTQPMDPRLLPIAGGPTNSDYDFSTGDGEYYDVYLSTDDGTPDTNGCCLTIVCNQPEARTNYDAGGNIDAVDLDFADGLQLHATSVGEVQLGQGLTDPNLYFTSGAATNALGQSDGIPTYLGYSVSRITLCFSTPCPPGINMAIEPVNGDTVTLTWTNVIWNNTWKLVASTNILGPWLNAGSSNPPVHVPMTNAVLFFRLQNR